MKHIWFILRGGVLAVLVVFFLKTATFSSQTVGSENFISWFSAKVYNDIFHKYGERKGERAFTRRLFIADDMKDAGKLGARLGEATTPLEKYLRGELSDDTAGLLGAGSGDGDPSGLKRLLARDLNRLIRGGNIYNKKRFEGTALRADTMYLLILRRAAPREDFGDTFEGEDIVEDESTKGLAAIDVNRKLIEDAFQEEISPVPQGSTVWLNTAPHVKLYYYVVPLAVNAFILGVVIAGLVIGVRLFVLPRLRGAAAENAEPSEAGNENGTLAAHWPFVVSLAGVFWAGHALGLVGYILSARTRSRAWVRVLSRACGAAVVMLWGVGTDLYWKEGWSKIYPGINHILKGLFGIFGITF